MINIQNPINGYKLDAKYNTEDNLSIRIQWEDTYEPPGVNYNIYLSKDGAIWDNIATNNHSYDYTYDISPTKCAEYIGQPDAWENNVFKVKVEDSSDPTHYDVKTITIRYIAINIVDFGSSTYNTERNKVGYRDVFNILWELYYDDHYTSYDIYYNTNPTGEAGWEPFNSGHGGYAGNIAPRDLLEYAFVLAEKFDIVDPTWSARFRLRANNDENYYDDTPYIQFNLENQIPYTGITEYADTGALTGNTPPVRFDTGMRMAGEKAIALDEALTLGQIEFGSGIRGRFRNKTGQLPDYETGTLDGIDRLLKAHNLVIEIDDTEVETGRHAKAITGVIAMNTDTGQRTQYGQLWYTDIAHNFGLDMDKRFNILVQLTQIKAVGVQSDPDYFKLEDYDVIPWYEPIDGDKIRVYCIRKGTAHPGNSTWDIDKFTEAELGSYKFSYRIEEVIV